MKLKDQIALVTGGGSGIGRAIALLFAEEGARVIVNDLILAAAQATLDAMGEAKSRARAIAADVSDSAQVRRMFAEIEKLFGGLDILVNNAGIAGSPEELEKLNRRADAILTEMASGSRQTHFDITQETTDEDWRRMLGVHLNGTFFCTREALRLMSRKNRGVIINMASIAGLRGLAGSPAYSAAKAGILGFTRSLAPEVASRNIRVNAICPGYIETPLTAPISAKLLAAWVAQTPMGRPGTPREVAATALFLASDESSYFTGQWLSPNGGSFIA